MMIKIYKDAMTKAEVLNTATTISKLTVLPPSLQELFNKAIEAIQNDKFTVASKIFNQISVAGKKGNLEKIGKTRTLCKALSIRLAEIKNATDYAQNLEVEDLRELYKKNITEAVKTAIQKMKKARNMSEYNQIMTSLVNTASELKLERADKFKIKSEIYKSLSLQENSQKAYEELQEKVVELFKSKAEKTDNKKEIEKLKASAISKLNLGKYEEINSKFIKQVIDFDTKNESKYAKYARLLEEILTSGAKKLKDQKEIDSLSKEKDKIYDQIKTVEEYMLKDNVNSSKTLSLADIKKARETIQNAFNEQAKKILQQKEMSTKEIVRVCIEQAEKTKKIADACASIVNGLERKIDDAKQTLKQSIKLADVAALKTKTKELIKGIEKYLVFFDKAEQETRFRYLIDEDDVHVDNIVQYSGDFGRVLEELWNIYKSISNRFSDDIRKLETSKSVYGSHLMTSGYYDKEINKLIDELEGLVRKNWSIGEKKLLSENITTKDETVLNQIRKSISSYDIASLLVYEINKRYKYGVHSDDVGKLKNKLQKVSDYLNGVNIPDSVSTVSQRYDKKTSTGKEVRQRAKRVKKEIENVISILGTYKENDKIYNGNPLDQTYVNSAMKLLGDSIIAFRGFDRA